MVRGHVIEAGSGEPIATATVTIVDGSGTAVAASVTDAGGGFLLAVLGSGTYRLKAERLGYTTAERGPLMLSVGDTVDVDVSMIVAPLLLDQILVSVRRAGRKLHAGEQLLYGRLVDDSTHAAISGGTLRLLTRAGQVAASTLSNDDGLFWLVSPKPGSYRLQGERIGYKTAESQELKLMLGDSIGVDFYLSMQAVLLDPITVTASARTWANRADVTGMDEFFTRYQMFGPGGYGEFMTRDSIAVWEKMTPSIGDMLLANMPEVRNVTPSGEVVVRDGRFSGGVLHQWCIPRYYVDGVPAEYGGVSNLMPGDLEGVELYASPNIPAQFNQPQLDGRPPCGVVLLWTRRSPEEHPAHRSFITGALAGVLLALTLFILR